MTKRVRIFINQVKKNRSFHTFVIYVFQCFCIKTTDYSKSQVVLISHWFLTTYLELLQNHIKVNTIQLFIFYYQTRLHYNSLLIFKHIKNNYIHCKQVFNTIYIVEQTVIQNKNLTCTETRCSVLSANMISILLLCSEQCGR